MRLESLLLLAHLAAAICLASEVTVMMNATTIAVEDYFTPQNYADLNSLDADLGSTGPLLVPGPT